MSKVQLKIPPWIAGLLNKQNSDWLIIEKEIAEGATITDLLVELTSSYDGFRKVVFNPDIGKVSDQIMVLLNDNLLQESDIIEAKLNDGDNVVLIPVLSGG